MKAVDARQLAQVLQQLPEGAKVACNQVGNLLVLSPEGDYIGFVDMRFCEFDRFDDSANEPQDKKNPGP